MLGTSLDVLITDHCNQSCAFCFASSEMSNAGKKEMSFADFKLLVNKMKKAEILSMYVLGGEPTIHPQFIKMMKYALKHFFSLFLLSNGTFPLPIRNFLLSVKPRISVQFNLATPGFIFNKPLRAYILDNIRALAPEMDVVVAINSTFQSDFEAKSIINLIPRDILPLVETCLCFSKPVAGNCNFLSLDDYPRAGSNLVKVVKYLKEIGPPKLINLISGYAPCMFNDEQRKYMIENVDEKMRYNCHSDFNDSWFTVSSDLSIFKCLPLSERERMNINPDSDLTVLKEKYQQITKKYETTLVLEKCKTCPFYGFTTGKCSGPCLAFRWNELNKLGIKKGVASPISAESASLTS